MYKGKAEKSTQIKSDKASLCRFKSAKIVEEFGGFMINLNRVLACFLQECKGATAIEYGLIAAGISVAISLAVFAFGGTLNDLFFTQLPSVLSGP